MNIYEFLLHHNLFITRAEIRRTALSGGIKIAGNVIKYEDLQSPISQFAKIGDIVEVGQKSVTFSEN